MMFLSIVSTVLLQIGELVEGIFQAGFWTALILVVLIGVVIFWLVRKFRN